MAVLSYLDFFAVGLQRTAVATAANICKHASPDSFHLVEDSVRILSDLLQHAVRSCGSDGVH
jgi:E3 ubiquitin-protein ligase TRIP12